MKVVNRHPRISNHSPLQKAMNMCAFVLILTVSNLGFSQELPAPLTSALMLKIVELEQSLSEGQKLTIAVINDKPLARILLSRQGKAIKNSQLNKILPINNLSELREVIPDIIFVGRTSSTKNIIKFANTHNILTITENIEAVSQGVILALYNNEGIPGILLNLSASKANGFQWQPEILNVASILK